MLSHNQRKLILQLEKKKHRLANKLFVAEGRKVINELINSEKLSKDNKKLNEKLLISESIVEAVSVSKKKIEFERDNFLKDFMQKEEKLIMMEEENSVLNGKVKVLRNQLENLKEDMQKTSAKNLGFRVYGFQQHNMHAYYGDIHCVHD